MPARSFLRIWLFVAAFGLPGADFTRAEDWPGWRGPHQDGSSTEAHVPVHWSTSSGIRWRTALEGEGSSSPIVWGNHVFVTSASQGGERRWVQAIDRRSGASLWKRELIDPNPEPTSPLTGHAAATPVTDGQHVYAWFGNAGAVCFNFAGEQQWHRRLGEFETELGLASSPVLHGDQLLILCDHDGNRFRSFDSFLISLNRNNGDVRWRAERSGAYRSWATPLVCPTDNEVVVAGDHRLSSYDLTDGKVLWNVEGLQDWVAPSPISQDGLIVAMCGRNGPILVTREGRPENATERLVWQHPTGGAYVCSPLVHEGRLYVHNERGILTCYDVNSGKHLYQQRLEGLFYSSAVIANQRIYIINEEGATFVIRPGPQFELLGTNKLEGEFLASPAIAQGCIFLRARSELYCIGP